jgi:glycerophosphoryl diester phosphodiesterase
VLTWRQRRRPRQTPLVIAHRGASAHAVENTLAAFRRAREDGADGVELDVQLCKTGEPVVFHDEDLARLAGRPDRLADLPLAALREVRSGGGIPTLDEALEELGPLLVNVEVKAPRLPPRRLVPEVVASLRRHDLGGRALVSSFNPLVLAQLFLVAPDVPRALIFGAGQALPLRRGWSRTVVRPAAVHPEHVLVTQRRLAWWHLEGHAVNAWTVDDPATIARLVRAGIDGIITNDPAATRVAVLASRTLA